MKPWIDGKAVDREIAEETPCPECGSSMHYEPRFETFLEGEPPTYRAFCVCDNSECDEEIEFKKKGKIEKMKIISCLILLCLFSIPAAPAGQSFDVLRLDLGPDFYNSLPLANGYQWTARGRIYPAGTMAARPPCVSEIEAPAIGNYLIRGLTGNQSEHLAVYAVRLNVGTPDLKQYVFSGLVQTGLDDEGFPRLFFDAASLLSEPGRIIFVEYLPRSASCFGGQLKIYTQREN